MFKPNSIASLEAHPAKLTLLVRKFDLAGKLKSLSQSAVLDLLNLLVGAIGPLALIFIADQSSVASAILLSILCLGVLWGYMLHKYRAQ
jgi:hypothetical protein